jgi:hypothetical protein
LIRGEDDEEVVAVSVVVVAVDEPVDFDVVSCGGAEIVPVMSGTLGLVSCGGAEIVTTAPEEVDEVEVVGGVVVDVGEVIVL